MTFLLTLLVLILALTAVAWVGLVTWWNRLHPERHWDWSNIDTSVTRFPERFLWGVATAAHQTEGGNTRNNWAAWEKAVDDKGQPRIKGGQVCGQACDSWNRYAEDARLARDLGCNAFRLSIEWSRLEPQPGQWDEEAVARYHAILDALKEQGLRPMVTLHHFTSPQWFDQMGGFEDEANLPVFVRFCERVFETWKDKVDLWCTLNEPSVFSTMGWGLGRFPPGKVDFALMARVQRNLLLAHARVWRRLKELPGGKDARIGIVNNIAQFNPHRRWHLVDHAVCRILDRAFNTAIQDYLLTGTYSLQIPGLVRFSSTDPEVKGTGDFIGLNYYAHQVVKFQLDPKEFFVFTFRPDDIPTDMPYAFYPEGFKQALHFVSRLGLPVIVTENGIADARDDRRALWIERYLFALHRAMEDGCDVRGYFYWCLVDNFEWAEGYDMKFGLYSMDPETGARTLKEGSRTYARIVKGATHAA